MTEETTTPLTPEESEQLHLMASMYMLKSRQSYLALDIKQCLNEVRNHQFQMRRRDGFLFVRLLPPETECAPLKNPEWAVGMKLTSEQDEPIIAVQIQLQDKNADDELIINKEFYWRLEKVMEDIIAQVSDDMVNKIFAMSCDESLKRSQKALMGES